MAELLDTYIADIDKSISIVKGSLTTHKQAPISTFLFIQVKNNPHCHPWK